MGRAVEAAVRGSAWSTPCRRTAAAAEPTAPPTAPQTAPQTALQTALQIAPPVPPLSPAVRDAPSAPIKN